MAKNLTSFLGQYSNVVVNTDMKENATCEVIFSMASARGYNGIGVGDNATHNGIFGGAGSPNFYKWDWIVPGGVSTATFHIWGGGGSGAGANCCMTGVSGGSGAYAFKTVSVTPGECYRTCFEGYTRYCCTNDTIATGSSVNGQAAPYLMYGLRGMKTYVTGTGLTNFCAEGGNPGVTRCGFGWGQNQQNDSPNQFPGNTQCQLWKICHVVKRRTIDSDNDRYAVAKYYGADGGSKGMYACHRMGCCTDSYNMSAERCGDREIIPFPGGLTPNRWAPYGDIELPSIHGGHIHLKACQITLAPHGSHWTTQMTQYLGYICNNLQSGMVGVGGLSASACGGGCCCGSPGGVPFLRIEYS